MAPIFEYKAYAPGGAVKTGVIDADTPRAARQLLRRDNVLVSDLRELRGRRKGAPAPAAPGAGRQRTSFLERLQELRASPSGPRGRDLETVAAITRQLGTLLGAG